MDAVDHLCDFCTEALTIDDSLGSVKQTCDGTDTLDVIPLALNDWRKDWRQDAEFTLQEARHIPETLDGPGLFDRDESGWEGLSGECGGRDHQARYVCTTQDLKKIVAPSAFAKFPESKDQDCRFCARLRDIFRDHYSQCIWWNDPASLLRITIQYEWTVRRATLKGKELAETSEFDKETHDRRSDGHFKPWGEGFEAVPWQQRQKLECLAVFVRHPGHEAATSADVYTFDVSATAGRCRDWLKIQHNPANPAGPLSDGNLQIMKKRIDDCIENHPNLFREFPGTPEFPTRVLDIEAQGHARLVDSKYLLSCSYRGNPADPQFRYAALSYCWGQAADAKEWKTTKERIETYQVHGIPHQILPATFLDAISVARKLGIRYLWIDALCIIQEDAQDWEAESSRMSSIFRNSYVTICVATGSSSSERFLVQPRKETLALRFCSSLDSSISGLYSVLLGGKLEQDETADFDIRNQKWRTRGWIYQEEIMSARMLIFGNNLVQFRCHGKAIMEPEMVSHLHHNSHIHGLLEHCDWLSVAESYSRRQLTFSSDRLSAVAGVAKCFSEWSKLRGKALTYLAGLWLDDQDSNTLGRNLLWVCDPVPSHNHSEFMEILKDEKNYCAPSWSWASRMTGVSRIISGQWFSAKFKVHSNDVQPAFSDDMVKVKFGSSLTLHGIILKSPIIPRSEEFIANAKRCLDRWVARTSSGEMEFWLDWTPNLDDPKEQTIQSRLQLFVIEAPEYAMGYCQTSNRDQIVGLILQLYESSKATLYYRVGVFRYTPDSGEVTKALMNNEHYKVTII